CFFFQAEDGIRDRNVTGVQTCALPILSMDYLFSRTDNPQGKLYEYRPKIAAGSDEMKQFIEMCFDPQSPLNEKLKQTIFEMMNEIGRASCRERVQISVMDEVLIGREGR